MKYLKRYCLIPFFLFFACASESSENKVNNETKNTVQEEKTFETDRSAYKQTANGLYYKIHTANEGEKAKLNDFIIADLSYETESGYDIFAKDDLAFSFSQQLFGGAINEGLEMMTKGDSATFIIPANKIYQNKLPSFVKEQEGIVFQIKLFEIMDEKAYKQQMRVRSQSSKPVEKKS